MKKWFKVFLIFFVLGLLLYFNSLNNKFLMDDYVFLSNPVMSGTKFILSQWNPYQEQALGVLDGQENLGYYRPLAHMVLDFCYATFKNNYWQYHLFNLFLFVFASSLIYLFIDKVTGNYNLASLAGLFYLIHPINGIVVNYISAIVFALQVICTLGTILLLLESLEKDRNQWLYFLSLLFSFSSLFWNESGIMVPFYVSAVIFLYRKDSFKEKAFYLLPYFLIVLFYISFRSFLLGSNESILKRLAFFHMTGSEYVSALFKVYTWYISQLFYPQGIVMQWATPISHNYIILNIWGACLLLILSLLLFIKFSQEKACQLGLIFILIGFAPVSLAAFIAPENGAQIEPHWFVFSSIGFFILAAHFCLILLDRTKKIGLVLLSVLIFSWSSVSYANNQLWFDQKTYSLYWSEQVPGFKLAYFYLAEAYQKEGALKESEKYYKMELSGYSSDIFSYINLGVIDQAQGHFKEAESDYKMALKINPYSAATYDDLGAVFFAEGRWDKARESFDQSLKFNPLLTEPRIGLAVISLKNSEYQKAIDLCLENLTIVHDDTETLFLLVNIYAHKSDLVNLRKYANFILNDKIDPGILMRLGVEMAQININDIALDCYRKVLHVAPDYKDAYYEIGKLLDNAGRYEEAIHIWKLGLSIDPSDQRFKNSIAKARALKSH